MSGEQQQKKIKSTEGEQSKAPFFRVRVLLGLLLPWHAGCRTTKAPNKHRRTTEGRNLNRPTILIAGGISQFQGAALLLDELL